MKFILQICVILLFSANLCWSFDIACQQTGDIGKLASVKNLKISLDRMVIRYQANVDDYFKVSSDAKKLFPSHEIIFSGALVDDQNKIITHLGESAYENVITHFQRQKLADSDGSEGEIHKCEIKFQENSSPFDSVDKSKNITIEIYNAVVKEAKLCIKDYLCQLSENVETDFVPIRRTKSGTVNAMVDFVMSEFLRMVRRNPTLPIELNSDMIKANSLTIFNNSEIRKISNLSIRQNGPNILTIRGFYDVTSNFTLNNFSMAAGTIRCDKLPISADKLQIAFDASMNSVHNNCQFSLNQLKYFNLPDAIFVDLSKIKEDNPKWSFLGIVGYGVNLLSNVDSFRYYMYTKIMDALENVVHDEVGKINWEKYTNYFVPNVRMLFEKDF